MEIIDDVFADEKPSLTETNDTEITEEEVDALLESWNDINFGRIDVV